uniref:cDNA FLJ16563 fis, clone SYNOV4005739 n=1 Tax=Homo sapiens TaxID=9606 RepID=Q6ZMZ4_HUMAN|nr:unnamed protein product [Homo sapiens]
MRWWHRCGQPGTDVVLTGKNLPRPTLSTPAESSQPGQGAHVGPNAHAPHSCGELTARPRGARGAQRPRSPLLRRAHSQARGRTWGPTPTLPTPAESSQPGQGAHVGPNAHAPHSCGELTARPGGARGAQRPHSPLLRRAHSQARGRTWGPTFRNKIIVYSFLFFLKSVFLLRTPDVCGSEAQWAYSYLTWQTWKWKLLCITRISRASASCWPDRVP